MDSNFRYSAIHLIEFAKVVLEQTGLDEEKSRIVGEILVEADLMGHTTHGLQLLPSYVKELEDGNMLKTGEPASIRDAGAAITWNGNYLPGPWLVYKAIDLALERITEHPVVTIVIQRSHHIACLAAYLERVTNRGYIILLSCSDPKNKTVAPFGGKTGVYSPNPMAAGIPGSVLPILMDVSLSTTANAYVKRAYDENKKLPHQWLLDKEGNVTDDPVKFYGDEPATILPLGGQDSGHKGFALGILVEALTNALGGYGRAEEPERWTASVFIQIINPGAFSGSGAFVAETDYLSKKCLDSGDEVRLPGQRALSLKKQQLTHGLTLYPTVIQGLKELSQKFDVTLTHL
ncbi:Ldh family oxidoreductase [Pedobacter sp. P351]|uniref:Ldh family oxidoreductase n=1 Tax=Pedobacter superstes TaxID=3133441 RepID=UPI0030AC9C67